jgi:hypothetical protein
VQLGGVASGKRARSGNLSSVHFVFDYSDSEDRSPLDSRGVTEMGVTFPIGTGAQFDDASEIALAIPVRTLLLTNAVGFP